MTRRIWIAVLLLGICQPLHSMAALITLTEQVDFSVENVSQFGPDSSPAAFAVGPVNAGAGPFDISFTARASSGSLTASQSGFFGLLTNDIQARVNPRVSLQMLYAPAVTSFSTFLGAQVTTRLTVDTGFDLVDGSYCVLCPDISLQGNGSVFSSDGSPLTVSGESSVELPRVTIPLVDLIVASLDAEIGLSVDQALQLDLFSFDGLLHYERSDSEFAGSVPFSLPFCCSAGVFDPGEFTTLFLQLPTFGTWDFSFSNLKLVNEFSNAIDLSAGVGASLDIVGLDPISLAYADDLFSFPGLIDAAFALDFQASALPDFRIEVRSVPEPDSLLLFAAGLILIVLWRGRRVRLRPGRSSAVRQPARSTGSTRGVDENQGTAGRGASGDA